MDAGLVDQSRVPGPANLQRVGGWLCAAGFAGITLTSLLYALAPPAAALPMPVLDVAAALAGTMRGASLLRSAGVIGILSDITAASGAVLVGQWLLLRDRTFEAAGWSGIAVSILLFTIVDAMAGLVLVPLAADPAMQMAFIAAKRLFDALFLTGTVAFGVGLLVFLAARMRQPRLVWGWATYVVGIAIGGVATVASLACIAGLQAQLAVGGSIGAGGVLCTWMSVRMGKTAQPARIGLIAPS